MFTSVRVDFGRPPLSSSTSYIPSRNREYYLKTFDWFTASFPLAFCTNTSVSVADRPALKQNLMATLCSIPPSMMYKRTVFTRQVIIRTLSKMNKRNSVCERMLVDSTQWVGQQIALVLLFKKISPEIYGPHCVCISISRHYAESRWLLQTSISICINCEVELQVLRRACVQGSEVPIPLTDIKKEKARAKEWMRKIFLFWVSISLLAMLAITD